MEGEELGGVSWFNHGDILILKIANNSPAHPAHNTISGTSPG